MDQEKEITAEVRELPSGFWAVFINGDFVDASSASEEEARAKLDQFLRHNHIGKKERSNERKNRKAP